MRRTKFIVAKKGGGGVYVLATFRTFTLYSEAQLFLLSVDASKDPIIIDIS
jgi:hypothetical protein